MNHRPCSAEHIVAAKTSPPSGGRLRHHSFSSRSSIRGHRGQARALSLAVSQRTGQDISRSPPHTAEAKRRDEKIKELTEERADALKLVDSMREHVKEAGELIDSWVYVFDLERNEAGNWVFDSGQSALWEAHNDLLGRHNKVIRDWNKFVHEYNAAIAPRAQGRPLAASEAQVKDVLQGCRPCEQAHEPAQEAGVRSPTRRRLSGEEEGGATGCRRRLPRCRSRAPSY
jgi:hypothetical protein